MNSDDDSPELRAQNARLLNELHKLGYLDPCESCQVVPAIRRGPRGRPEVLPQHEPWCWRHDDHTLTAETEVEPIRVALDWLTWKARKPENGE